MGQEYCVDRATQSGVRPRRYFMSYQIKVVECDGEALEVSLDAVAREGWQLVSCWPTGASVRAVFQRQSAEVPSPRSNSRPANEEHRATPVAPTGSSAEITLDAVIATCLEEHENEPPERKNFNPGVRFKKLGEKWGLSGAETRAKLEQLGVKDKAEGKSKDLSHKGFYIWFKGNFVNIQKPKDHARKTPGRK